MPASCSTRLTTTTTITTTTTTTTTDGKGLIFPDKSSLFLAAIEDGEYMDEKISYWDNVYGFDMSCIKDTAMLEPLVDEVNGQAIVSSIDKVITIDIMTCTVDDLREFRRRASIGRAMREPTNPSTSTKRHEANAAWTWTQSLSFSQRGARN